MDKDFDIRVNDIFDELSEENKRLNEELMFANNCLKVLNEFKSLLNKFYLKFHTIIDSEDKQEFSRLQEMFTSLTKPKQEINENKAKIEYLEESCPQYLQPIKTEHYSYESIDGNEYQLSDNTIEEKSTEIFEIIEIRDQNQIHENYFQTNESHSTAVMDRDYGESDGNDVQIINSSKNQKKKRKKKLFVCYYDGCHKPLNSKQTLINHIKRVHTLEKSFKCEICSKSFVTNWELTDHKKQFHSNSWLSEYRARNAKNSKKHIKRRHSSKGNIVECDYEDCHQRFKSIPDMKRHKKEYHSADTLSEWAQNSTSDSCIETIDGKFICDFKDCAKRFDTKKKLFCHRRGHLKRFVCEWTDCQMRFRDRTQLKKHMIIHNV